MLVVSGKVNKEFVDNINRPVTIINLISGLICALSIDISITKKISLGLSFGGILSMIIEFYSMVEAGLTGGSKSRANFKKDLEDNCLRINPEVRILIPPPNKQYLVRV